MNHTPGPWEVLKGGNFVRVGGAGYIQNVQRSSYLGKHSGGICELDCEFPFSGKDEETIANAELIASAPDMAEELERLRDQQRSLVAAATDALVFLDRLFAGLITPENTFYDRENLRSALKKAEG